MKYLEVNAPNHGIMAHIIFHSVKNEDGPDDDITSTLKYYNSKYLEIDALDRGITAQINLHFIICKDDQVDYNASTMKDSILKYLEHDAPWYYYTNNSWLLSRINWTLWCYCLHSANLIFEEF